MDKKRILSVILSVLMLVTILLPVGAFAEEDVQGGYEEPAYEEPVGEEPVGEEPVNEEPAGEEPANEEPVDEEPVNEEPAGEETVNEEPTVDQLEETVIEEELVEAASVDEPEVAAAATITITVQPTSKTVAPGELAKFGLAATGNGLTYQWQVQLVGKTTWQDTTLDGNQTKLLSFTAKTDYSGRKYRCVVTDSSGNTATTNAATLTVGTPITITVQPTSKTVAPGETAKFGLAATGNGLTYQWQVQLVGKTTWQDTTLEGNDTKLLSFTAKTDYSGRKYRCVVTDSSGNTATTNAATLTVGTPIVITVQPTSKTVAPGETAKFGMAATGTGLTYQWQVQLVGKTTWQNTTLGGNDTKLLSFTAKTEYSGRKFRCVVTDSSGNTATTNAATLTVSTSEFVYEDITSTTCRLVKYNGTNATVSVPQTYNGKTVTEIGPDAFLNNTTLTSIDLPDTITVIGARAFKGCTKLSSMS